MATSGSLSTDWMRSAGDFQCTACQRKRLPASQFSKRQAQQALDKSRTHPQRLLLARCKECVAKEEAAQVSAAKKEGGDSKDDAELGEFKCKSCKQLLSGSCFSKNQRAKAQKGQPVRCTSCVQKAEAKELQASQDKAAAERKSMEKLSKSGGVAAALAAACNETAAEAEAVTGIKATRRGRGRGRGYRR
eukprot:CAMPEP_0203760638 /NCGR_PEP_ID=MMETSP0098-20131031/13895_1 /ASSEMBLY_ACC=CAM_ASM_000208 /TAXON_ID=96639 /ORGANISM=" , Strain NY0313808BC1" /LENGTH=189 /DNA_ID=CAMNT_0050654295 /DNA_START=115 /DNA_END=687 /DNA_ORIENTATION=+